MRNWLPSELIDGLGWTLLHFVWQGLVIALLLAAGLRLLRNKSANHRYLIGCGALLCVIIAPALTFRHFAPNKPPPLAQISSSIEIPAEAAPIIVVPSSPVATARFPLNSAPPQTTIAERVKSILPWLVLVWFAGVFVFSIRLMFGWWRVNRLKRADGLSLAVPLLEQLAALTKRLGIRRPLRAIQSALVEVPTVIGWLRPVLLLPASCVVGLNPIQLEAILTHELAHVRRHDYLVNLLQNVVETLLFYHPAVWWISHRIREERENCCDDLAVRICGDPVAYARALATLEELRPAPAQLVLAAGGAPLLQRIKRLLGRNRDSAVRPVWPLAGIFAALLLIGVAVGLRGHRVLAANANAEQTSTAKAMPTTNSAPVTTNVSSESVTNRSDRVTATTLVQDGKFYYEANRLDEAEDKLTRAVKLDPSSVAANFYLRLVKEKRQSNDPQKSEFAAANALSQVEAAWNVEQHNGQLIPRPNTFNRTNLIYTTKGRQNILPKLDRIRIDSFKFDNQKLSEAMRQLSSVAKANDPDREGINFMLDKTRFVGPGGEINDASEVVVRLNTTLRNVRLADVLEVIVKCADQPIKYSIMDYAISFSPGAADTSPLQIRTFQVDTNLMHYVVNNMTGFQPKNVSAQQASSSFGTAQPATPQFTAVPRETTDGTTGDGIRFVTRENSKLFVQFLDAAGISFSTNTQSGKSYLYNERKGVLTIRSTAQDLDLIAAILNCYQADLDGNRTSAIILPSSPTPEEHYQKVKAENEANHLKKTKILVELQALKPAEMRQVLPAKVPDAILSALLQDLESAQNHLAMLVDAFGPDHPDVKRAQALVNDLDQHINTRIAGIMEGIKTEIATSKAIINSAETKLKELRPKVADKLDRIHIDPVQFSNTPFADVVTKLNELATDGDPEQIGMNFIVEGSHHPLFAYMAPDKGASPLLPALDDPLTPARVTLSWNGGPLAEFLDAIVAAADRPLKYSVHDFGAVFSPKQPEPPLLAIRTFRVDPESFRQKLEHIAGPIPAEGPESPLSPALRRFFAELGIALDTNSQSGRTFMYGDRRGVLTVRATMGELDRVAEELRSVTPPETMVRFKVRIAEVTTVEEPNTLLYFSHLMPAQLLTNASGTFSITEFIAGGTNSTGSNLPPVKTVLSTNSVSLHAIGTLSSPQLKVALQSLEGRNGTDILTAPEVVTRNNQLAQIQVTSLQTIAVDLTNSLSTQAVPVGLAMDLKAHVSMDRKTFHLTVIPTVAEFLGYDKADAFIHDKDGKTASPVPLPHFRVRQMTISAEIRDGETLVLESPSVTSETKAKSKVPVLGDIPLIKGLFRSETSKTIKKQLVVFVTPTIVRPGDEHAENSK
jgi:beta-lactamase regulating signal transducer with metallopeptidase domain